MSEKLSPSSAHWRHRLHEIIFEADTPAGKAFDVTLFGAILLSSLVVILESVSSLRLRYGSIFLILEWFFTLLFTVEYILRLVSVHRPLHYAFSFFGLVDLLAIVPTYFSLLMPSSHYLVVIRIIRLLRIFRVLKLAEYLQEAAILERALVASRRKISVFLLTVLLLVVVIGTLMYVIEGEQHGFVDIPTSIYWAIVTLTTVGYGDVAPRTPLGQLLASAVMLLGYGILAVPTGIVTMELTRASRGPVSTQACPACGRQGHDYDAVHCKYCGAQL
jgi:voltage-gated potassium channel